MEQQNQQPTQEKSESKSLIRIKTKWKFIVIVALIAVVVSVGGILLLSMLGSSYIEQIVFGNRVNVLSKDQQCAIDADCAVIRQRCGCSCVAEAVNKAYEQKYQQQEIEACENYEGLICDIYCKTPQYARCANGRCVMSAVPSPTDISAWQTYRNDEFGFEVKYPPDWLITSFESIPPADIYGWTTMSIFSPDREVEVFISRGIPYEHVAPGGITTSRTPQAIIENKRKGFAGYSFKEKQVSIGSREAVKFTYSDSYAFIDVYVPLDDTILLQITQRAKSQKGESYEPIFDQILSTFRFVENSTDGTSDQQEISKGVTVKTDKTEYVRRETVIITMENRAEAAKWVLPILQYYSVERFDNNGWIQVRRVACPCDVVCNPPPPLTLQTGTQEQFKWNQEESFCDNFKKISGKAVPGRYRIKIIVSNVNDTQENWE